MMVIQGSASNKDELLKQISDALDNINTEIDYDSSVYSFPEIKTHGDCAAMQMCKVMEEVLELNNVVIGKGFVEDALEEAWDVIQSVETLMRIIADIDEVIDAHDKVLDKNHERGYYEECE